MNFEQDSVVTVKLSTGQELVAKWKGIENTTFSSTNGIRIDRPVELVMSPKGLAFAPYTPTMEQKDGMVILVNHILSIGPTVSEVVTAYNNAISPIKTAGKPNLII